MKIRTFSKQVRTILIAGSCTMALFSCTITENTVDEPQGGLVVQDNLEVEKEIAVAGGSTNSALPVAEIQGDKIYDFGDIAAGDVVEHTFTIKNTGAAPLIISNIQTTCGCTTPDFERGKAIAPGSSTDVLVRFNSRGKSGIQNKKVTIFTNTAESVQAVYMKGNVNVSPAS